MERDLAFKTQEVEILKKEVQILKEEQYLLRLEKKDLNERIF
jgi:regulator of replication initiation timing